MNRDRAFRFLFLFLLLIPCWAIFIKYEVDIRTIFHVSSVLPNDPLRAYEPEPGLGRYFYGPFSLVLLRPLAALSFVQLKVFWLALQTAAYFIFWLVLERLFPALKEKGAFWKWLVVWVFAINPIHNNFQSNNIQLVLAAAVILTEYWSRTRSTYKQVAGAMLLVFAAAIKIFPLFLVAYYFLVGSKKMRWGILGASLVALVAPLVVFGGNGVPLYESFFRNLRTYEGDNSLLRVPDILCLPSLLARIGFAKMTLPLTALLAGGFFGFAWKYRKSRSVWTLAWALMVLLNPSTRVHYFVFAIPLCCFFLKEETKPWLYGAFAGMAMLALTTETAVGKYWNDRLEFWSVPTWGLILMCVLARFLIAREFRNDVHPVPNRK